MINVFRSFLHGKGSAQAWRVMAASRQWPGETESRLFLTAPVRDALFGDQWHNRLRPVGDAPRQMGLNSVGLAMHECPLDVTAARESAAQSRIIHRDHYHDPIRCQKLRSSPPVHRAPAEDSAPHIG
jgi:hypothetical protein